ncbi:hypothetical protein [Acinetobacter sp. ANC 4862]|uniref:coiled-coil domain-containing protein n=1 Tax=Acinetobacter sp. ANC 4862 TaxID=2529849 RepID=UPI00103C5EBB|nr:hypothetical protein [Acinetobacter sp. ANC 4862]TCH63088.1 hypothetical protein E0409_11610 [Acinetobacter sp. ANC 4862]
MKNIYLIRAIYAFFLLLIVCVLVAINNFFFYKNEEKATVREMRYEAAQLQALIQNCESRADNCTQMIKTFMDHSSIKGKITLSANTEPFYAQNLEGYKDNRIAVTYQQSIQAKDNLYVVSYEKLVTPPLFKSMLRSVTFSVMEWNRAAQNGINQSYWKNLINYWEFVAIPRSSPALCYFFLIIVLLLLGKGYFKTLLRKWESSEQAIIAKNDLIEQLHNEKLKLKSQNTALNKQLDQAELAVNGLEKQHLAMTQEKQQLDSALIELNAKITLEKEQLKGHIRDIKAEKLKAMQEAEQKYANDVDHILQEKTLEINQYYANEISLIKADSQDKIDNYEHNLQALAEARQDLALRNTKLLEDLDASTILMDEVERKLQSTETENKQLQEKLKVVQDELVQEKQTQNTFMTKDLKKWIARYLLANPNFNIKSNHSVPKHNGNDHHGNDYVEKIFNLVRKNEEISKFVKAVKSVNNNAFQQRTIVVSKLKQKGLNDLNYGYIAEVVSEDDRGSCAGLFLTAQTDWEAIVQAKLLLIHVKQLEKHTIIDKISN